MGARTFQRVGQGLSEGLNTRAVRHSPDDAPRSTDELLRGVAAGEGWAHVALYDALLPPVLGALQRILRDASRDYEDLVQATFERIVRILVRDKKPPAENLVGWAAAIAAHVALDALRAKIRERRMFSNDAGLDRPDLGADVEGRLEAKRQLLTVQGHLARMKSRYHSIWKPKSGPSRSKTSLPPQKFIRLTFAAKYRICYGDNCLFTPGRAFIDALSAGA